MSGGSGGRSNCRTEPSPEDWRHAHDYAWRYFELHAGQRLTLFNFFTVLTGFATAGIATTMQGSARFSILGIALGALLVLLSFVFWKLDQRAAFLVKHSEAIQELAEVELLPESARLIEAERKALLAAQSAGARIWRIWTFGDCFRLIFAVAALLGMVSAVLCGLRFAGVVDWNSPAATEVDKRGASPATAGPKPPASVHANSALPATGVAPSPPAKRNVSP